MLLYPDSATGADNERSAMKINNLFAKGLVITAIASTLAIGAGVAGASASDGEHERNTSSSEHQHGSDHGHEDDDEDENGRGHETHGQGWGYGHGTGEDNCDDDASEESSDDDLNDVDLNDDDSAPVVTEPVVDVPVVNEPTVDIPVDSTPDTIVPDTTAPDTTAPDATAPDTMVARFSAPAVALEIPAGSAPIETPVTSPEVAPAADQIAALPSAPMQPQIVAAASGTARDAASTQLLTPVVETETTQKTVPSTSGNLPMTGASGLALLGLAASLLVAGWLVIAGRRKRNDVA